MKLFGQMVSLTNVQRISYMICSELNNFENNSIKCVFISNSIEVDIINDLTLELELAFWKSLKFTEAEVWNYGFPILNKLTCLKCFAVHQQTFDFSSSRHHENCFGYIFSFF